MGWFGNWVAKYGIEVVAGIVILVVGYMLAGWVSKFVRSRLEKKENFDQTLTGFIAGLVRWGILAITVIAVLNQFGIQTASLIAVVGALGLAVGLALQGTLANFAAGVMLLVFRPFKVGQFVDIAGTAGTVKDLQLFVTELATPDNVQIIVPNGKVWGSIIKNFSFHSTRRVDFVVGVGYDDDLDKALKTIDATVTADSRSMKDPAPQIVVGELADSSVNLIVRVWCAAGDYWDLKFDLTKAFKEALDKASISIPYPQTDVHVHQVEPKKPAASSTRKKSSGSASSSTSPPASA